MLENQNYKFVKNLGSGLTSTVDLIEDVETGQKYACKILKNSYFGGFEKAYQDAFKE